MMTIENSIIIMMILMLIIMMTTMTSDHQYVYHEVMWIGDAGD